MEIKTTFLIAYYVLLKTALGVLRTFRTGAHLFQPNQLLRSEFSSLFKLKVMCPNQMAHRHHMKDVFGHVNTRNAAHKGVAGG